MRDGGKGDTPRPIPNREQYESNWDQIFGKKQKKEDQDQSEPEKKDTN